MSDRPNASVEESGCECSVRHQLQISQNKKKMYDSSDAGFGSSSSPDFSNSSSNSSGRGNSNNNNNNNNNRLIKKKQQEHDGELMTAAAVLGYSSKSSSESLQEEESAGGWRRLAQVLLLGMLLLAADAALHLAVAGKYLALRDCHRGAEKVFADFSLAELTNVSSSIDSGIGGIGGDGDDDPFASSIKSHLTEQAYFRVRRRLVTLLPEHWLRRAHDIVDFQLSRWGGAAALARMCTLNGRSFNNALEAGAYVCRGALTAAQQMALAGAFHGVSPEREREVLEAMLRQDDEEMAVAVARYFYMVVIAKSWIKVS